MYALVYTLCTLCLSVRFLSAFENKKISSFIFFVCAFKYDAKAIYFDEGVRIAKREQLEAKLLQVMPPNSIYV